MSAALRALHQSALAAEQMRYERWHGRVGPGALLHLVLDDPFFAWLLPLSAFIAKIDGWVADPDAAIDASRLASVRRTIDAWILDSGDGNEFTASYLPLLQTSPDVVLAHAAVRRALSS